jgi:NOL1/NOP2/fmu family ribosome biogenesis protein
MMTDMPSTDKLKVLRPGLHLGTLKKNRFEPSHALALTLSKADVKRSMELGDNARAYLNGQTLNAAEGEKGWTLMTYKGYSIGWGKLSGNIMKNHYPKGLRKNG